MERPRPATLAIAGLVGYVATYDVMCPRNETISEGVDRAMETPFGRLATLAIIGVTAAHLANFIPEQYDPFARVLSFKDRPQ